MSRQLALLLCGVWLSITSRAAADPSEAKERFQQAREAHQAGDFRHAAELFEEANSLAPRAPVKYNAAIAWDQANLLARAAAAYEVALNMGGLVASEAEAARSRLNTLRSQLAYVKVDEPIGGLVSVAHIEQQPIPLVFYLEPGTYDVEVAYRDESLKRMVRLNAGQTESLVFETSAPRLKPEPGTPPPKKIELEDDPPPVVDESDPQKTWGWVAIGTSVALSGVATYLGVNYLDAREKFLNDRTSASKRNRAARLQTQTNATWVGAGVTGTVGVVLLLTSPTFEF